MLSVALCTYNGERYIREQTEPLPDRKEGEFWSDMEEIYHLD